MQLRRLFKKFSVLRIRRGVACLNIINTKFVQSVGNFELVRDRIAYIFTLRSVAKSRVKYLRSFHKIISVHYILPYIVFFVK